MSQPGAILTPCAMNLHAGSMVQPVPCENPGCEEVFGWEITIFTKDLKFINMVVLVKNLFLNMVVSKERGGV